MSPPPSRSDTAVRAQSSVDRIASGLRVMALSLREGEYLGSEERLTRHFRVSAPTLRQAARLLEHEQVIDVRRGVHGGYYVSRPKIETISRVGATYVRGNPGSIDEFYVLLEMLAPFIVDQALQSDRLSELAEFAVERPTLPPPLEYRDEEIRFSYLMMSFISNRPLELMLSIIAQVGLSLAEETSAAPQVNPGLQGARITMAQALLSGDRDLAIQSFLKLQQMLLGDVKEAVIVSKRLHLQADRTATLRAEPVLAPSLSQ